MILAKGDVERQGLVLRRLRAMAKEGKPSCAADAIREAAEGEGSAPVGESVHVEVDEGEGRIHPRKGDPEVIVLAIGYGGDGSEERAGAEEDAEPGSKC